MHRLQMIQTILNMLKFCNIPASNITNDGTATDSLLLAVASATAVAALEY